MLCQHNHLITRTCVFSSRFFSVRSYHTLLATFPVLSSTSMLFILYPVPFYFLKRYLLIYSLFLAASELSFGTQDLRGCTWPSPWLRCVGCVLSCPSSCGILVPRPGIKPKFPALEGGFLIPGPPGKPPIPLFDRELGYEFLITAHQKRCAVLNALSVTSVQQKNGP